MTHQRPLGLGTHIFVPDADAAVAFYSQAFGAAELIRHRLPDGRVLFVELAVGPDKLLLSEEIAELNALAPSSLGGSPVMLLLELDDVDGTFEHAVEMGATVEMPVPRCSGASGMASSETRSGITGPCVRAERCLPQTRLLTEYQRNRPTAPGPTIELDHAAAYAYRGRVRRVGGLHC
jgi:PhnB protein